MMNKLDEKYLKIMELALKLNPDPANRLSTGYKPTIEVSYDGARAYLFVRGWRYGKKNKEPDFEYEISKFDTVGGPKNDVDRCLRTLTDLWEAIGEEEEKEE
mgnify:FL=1